MKQTATNSPVKFATLDGNEAASSVAYRLTETIAIYPITPSSNMAEYCDEWTAKNKKNIWGSIPRLVEMQSEAGAAGAVHGTTQAGALSTTFTASQGLLLMIPNMFKIAGELLPFTMHVSARAVATHALSIFGDHSDVMACRQTGFAMLCSNSVQEAQDMAAIAHLSSLESRVPFLHFFDGFRTSHEVSKIATISDDQLRALVDEQTIQDFRDNALTPDRPRIRGTAQNPDVFFQAREACNGYYNRAPGIVQRVMDRFAQVVGRKYSLFEYVGHPEADRVLVMMGSGAEVAHETVDYLVAKGERIGLLKIRLFRPWSLQDFVNALPASVRRISVLDRTKEPGALGEPLYQDVITALQEAGKTNISVVGGRYGLSSKEFTPAMIKAVYDNLKECAPKNHFTVGINDDVTHLSLPYDTGFDIEPKEVVRSVFFGLGADGTVGANKNSIKIIGEETDNYAQGYFVYDSNKSGSMTISHLRFGPKAIRSAYLINRANFVACHQWQFIDRYEMLECAAEGATFLINSTYGPDKVWDQLPVEVQQQIIDKKLKVYVIDGYKVGKAAGMGQRINTIMQTCFFALSNVLPREEAIAQIKKAIEKTYSRKGEAVVQKNFAAVDQTLAGLYEVKVPAKVTATRNMPPIVPEEAPDFVKRVTALMLANKGDMLPVSAFPVDGTWPSATRKWEKRAIALEVPQWDPSICIQCNKCVLICPHAAIRAKYYSPTELANAPETFKSVDIRAGENKGMKFTIQVAPEDCTGCTICVSMCPAKSKTDPKHKAINMVPMPPIRDQEKKNFEYFLNLPNPDRTKLSLDVKGTQFMEPLFEFSGACAGCGETPYVKLMTQMYGDRIIVSNATGCSSIYGGNLPSTPYAIDPNGRGPAWSNSLFEDNAEYGFGHRFAIDKQTEYATELLKKLAPQLGDSFVTEIVAAKQTNEVEIGQQRVRVAELKQKLQKLNDVEAKRLLAVADYLVRKSVWILGGDGWAYDIGFGGLDHVIALNGDVNLLVMDTEVYSNTGGQQSKSTPMGAAAKFAVAGKRLNKKNLGLIAMAYGTCYVAQIAIGAKDSQAVKAFEEAESYPGTSLILAYSPCIAHGFQFGQVVEQTKAAVDTGYWPLFRYDPRRVAAGESGFKLDSAPPKLPLEKFWTSETRFQQLMNREPDVAKQVLETAQANLLKQYAMYERLAKGSTTPTEALKQ